MLSKKILAAVFACLIITAAGSASFAQSLPGDKAGRTADMLYKKLNLTGDQYTKVYQSLMTYFTKEASNRQMYKNRQELENANKKDWEAVKSAMSSVLNKDQLASYSGLNESSLMNPVMRVHHKKQVTSTEKKDVTGMTGDNTKNEVKKTETPKKVETAPKSTTTTKDNTKKKEEPKK